MVNHTPPNESKRSRYMEWAKTRSTARFNLATSGLTSVPMTEFPLQVADLEVTGGGYGYPPLLERIARHTGAPVECIVTTEGTSMANHLALAALLEPGDEVVIEEPTYGLLLDVAHYLGAGVKRIARRFEINFDIPLPEIERAITPATRLVVLTNLQNPTGALLPLETLRAIGAMAERVGARVLVDEVYLEMLFDSAPPSAFSLGDTFVVTSSLTKAYGLSGLRCGWILAAAGVGAPHLAAERSLRRDRCSSGRTDVGHGIRSSRAVPRARPRVARHQSHAPRHISRFAPRSGMLPAARRHGGFSPAAEG